jgi:hypothetical protein
MPRTANRKCGLVTTALRLVGSEPHYRQTRSPDPLHGEGPRSRSYERTTALRLFVQPYDEDEQFFATFYK